MLIKMVLYGPQLVLETFVGSRPKGFVACHNDGNKENNSLNNLRWDTVRNNQLDCIKHGNRKMPNNKGENNPKAKLNKYQVRVIRSFKEIEKRPTIKEISDFFNVCKGTISTILGNKGWAYV